MKRILFGILFAVASLNAFANAPDGAGRGWGSMLLKDQYGMATHVVATTANDISGNNAFGTTTGTNGCHISGMLSYGGKPLLVLGSMMDELSEDMTKGNGEALTAYAVVLSMQLQDREHSVAVTHEHFFEIFNKSDVTAADVCVSTQATLRQGARLVKYVERA